RDPVLRQAGLDRAAHGAAARAVHPGPARRRTRARRDADRRARSRTRDDGDGPAAAEPAAAPVGGRHPGPPRRHGERQPPGAEMAWRRPGRAPRSAGAAQRMTAPASPRGRVAFVVKGYPRLSETFIAQEILALEQRGLDILIVSLRHPTDRVSHPVHREIRAPLLYLPEYLHDEPARVLRGWRRARRLPG